MQFFRLQVTYSRFGMYALHQLEYICGGLLLKTGPRKMVLAQPISMGKDINIPQNDGREILQFMNI